jgi:hypothetical protein
LWYYQYLGIFFLPETSACVWNTEVKHVPDSPKRNAPQALVSGKKYIPRYYKIRYFIVQSRSQQGAESLVIYITQKNNKHSNT